MISFPLVEQLLSHRAPAADAASPVSAKAADAVGWGAIEALLQQRWDEARNAWPVVSLPQGAYLAHLARHLDLNGGPELLSEALSELRCADLYLACGCVHRDPAALAALGDEYLGQMELRLWELPNYEDLAQEIRHRVWEKLVAPAYGSPPKIQQYAGRGSLKSWLQTVVTREALGLLRQQKKERGDASTDDEEVFWRLACPRDDQEEQYLKRLYRDAFKEAFQDALASMEARDRTLLKYHYVDGLSSEQIGRIYRVHRATVARWLQRSREQLLAATSTRMHRQLGVSEGGAASIFRLIQSQLDLSLMRLLQK